jgi:hypothetical protein
MLVDHTGCKSNWLVTVTKSAGFLTLELPEQAAKAMTTELNTTAELKRLDKYFISLVIT